MGGKNLPFFFGLVKEKKMEKDKIRNSKQLVKKRGVRALILGVFVVFSFSLNFQPVYGQIANNGIKATPAASNSGYGAIGAAVGFSLFGPAGAGLGAAAQPAVRAAIQAGKNAASGFTGRVVPQLIDSSAGKNSSPRGSPGGNNSFLNSHQLPSNSKVASVGNGGKIQVDIGGQTITLHVHNKEVTGLPPGWQAKLFSEEGKVAIFPVANSDNKATVDQVAWLLANDTSSDSDLGELANNDTLEDKSEAIAAKIEQPAKAKPQDAAVAAAVQTPSQAKAQAAVEEVPGNIGQLAQRTTTAVNSNGQGPNSLNGLLERQETKVAAVMPSQNLNRFSELDSRFYSFAQTPAIKTQIVPNISLDIKPALAKLSGFSPDISTAMKPSFERLANTASQMPAELNPALVKLSQVNLASAKNSMSLVNLAQVDIGRTVNPTASFTKLEQISALAKPELISAFNKLERISTKISNASQKAVIKDNLVSPAFLKLGQAGYAHQSFQELKPGLASLAQTSGLVSLATVNIGLPSLPLRGLDLISIAEMGEFKALAIPQLNNLLKENRLKLPEINQEIIPIAESFFFSRPLDIQARLFEISQPKMVSLSLPATRSIVHGDNGQRKQVVKLLELSGIDVGNLLLAGQAPEVQSITYSSLEASSMNKIVEQIMAAFMLDNNILNRQLLLQVIE